VSVPDASLWSVMLLGLLFGIQHATDPDHVVAVATIVARPAASGRARWWERSGAWATP